MKVAEFTPVGYYCPSCGELWTARGQDLADGMSLVVRRCAPYCEEDGPGVVLHPRSMESIRAQRKAKGTVNPYPRGICATCGETVCLARDGSRTQRHCRPNGRGLVDGAFECDGGIKERLE